MKPRLYVDRGFGGRRRGHVDHRLTRVTQDPLGELWVVDRASHEQCDPGSVARAAERASDAQLVVNNAGIWRPSNPLQATLDDARAELETNYLGLISVTKAFAPVLADNGGGAFVNVLSVVSWVGVPSLATYSASKAAEWAYSNAARTQLATQGTEVVGVHVGYVDTDLTAELEVDKVARRASPSRRWTRWRRAPPRRSSTSSAGRSRPASPMTRT